MISKILYLLFFVYSICLSKADYSKLIWTDCGSPQIIFEEINASPMPVVHPGEVNVTFKAILLKDINYKIKGDIKIFRSVSGLRLPIKCYKINRGYFGSCQYDDYCDALGLLLPELFNPKDCPAVLAPYGIDCKCPFKIPATKFDIENLNYILPNLSDPNSLLNNFSSLFYGDYDITIKTANSDGPFACLNLKYSIKPKKKLGK